MRRFRLAYAFAAFILSGSAAMIAAPTPALAQSQEGLGFWLNSVRGEALAAGVSQRTIDSVFPTIIYGPKAVSYDYQEVQTSNTLSPFEPYRRKQIDSRKIANGRAKYLANRPLLARIEQQSGVPESIMVAIWGHETNYGSFMGNFDLIDSLASLAYAGRRKELWKSEFFATLKMIDQGVPRSRLKGSWAGATGFPQFLPSVWLTTAVDADGDGDKNIWSNEADALASIGNYFVLAGWRPNVPWGVKATVPASLDRNAIANRTVSPRCPRAHARHSQWKTMAEWRAMGLQAYGPKMPADTELATLLEPDGQGAPGYLLTSNFRAILDYNCSTNYALSIGVLADEVSN